MLFKVTAPRQNLVFEPRPFWHTADWKSSSTRDRGAGYQMDRVVYAGEFNEVNIHLFPPLRRLRVWLTATDRPKTREAGLVFSDADHAVIILEETSRPVVEAFTPTIFTFAPEGFERVPTGEFVSRAPVCATAVETLSMAEAIRRWKVAVNYVPALNPVIAQLITLGVVYAEQTH